MVASYDIDRLDIQLRDRGVSVKEFGAAGDGVKDDTAAVAAAWAQILAAPGYGTLIFPAGTYLMDPWTITNLTTAMPITIRGAGQAIWKFTAGTSGFTLGAAGPSLPVRRLTVENIEIIGSGALTNGISLLYAVDCQFRNVRVNGENGNITTGLNHDYGWDNGFYHFIVKTVHGVVLKGNRTLFSGARFESMDPTTGIGIDHVEGSANAFVCCDVSSWKYGYRISGPNRVTPTGSHGIAIVANYFEGNTENDIYFSGEGLVTGVSITGCMFNCIAIPGSKASSTNAIACAGSGLVVDGVSISGCAFLDVPPTAYIVVTDICWNWDIGPAGMYGSTALVSGSSAAHTLTRHRQSDTRLSGDNGDAAATLAVGDFTTQRWATALTTHRAVTLPSAGMVNGDHFRIVRSGGDTGGPWNLNVGTGPLKALTAGTWCDVAYDGSAWVLTGYGAL